MATNNAEKNKKTKESMANKFYETWMDYKDQERRASTATTETIASVKNGKYQLYDDYKAQISQTPTLAGTPPPQPVIASMAKAKRQSLPIIQPLRQRKEIPIKVEQATDYDNLSKDLMSKIKQDFGPFYNWVKNGRTDDLKKEIIEKLLFKKT